MRLKAYMDVDVVEAARQRLIQLFTNTCPMTLSFSGGKDSLCLLTLVLELQAEGRIDCSNLTVIYIDEEAMYEDVIDVVKQYRIICLTRNIKFIWYAIETKFYNCFNLLKNDESFMLFDRTKKDVWIREPPDFAVRDDPLLIPRLDMYQDFLHRKGRGGIDIIGIRESESVQRMLFMSKGKNENGLFRGQAAYPIYDWTDNDVWLFIKTHHIPFPEVYMRMYQTGVKKGRLRVAMWFSMDAAATLLPLGSSYPDLMARTIRREPNAYLAALYWDSEMFKRHTRANRELIHKDPVTVRNHVMQLLSNIPANFDTVHKREMPYRYRRLILKYSPFFNAKHWETVEEALISGDMKGRTFRALMINVTKYGSDKAGQERREDAQEKESHK